MRVQGLPRAHKGLHIVLRPHTQASQGIVCVCSCVCAYVCVQVVHTCCVQVVCCMCVSMHARACVRVYVCQCVCQQWATCAGLLVTDWNESELILR